MRAGLTDYESGEGLNTGRLPSDEPYLPRWRVEVSIDGLPFTWTGYALNQSQAINQAQDSARQYNPHKAGRINPVACIQVS